MVISSLMLLFGWGSKQPGSALALETITFTVVADDGRVVKDAARWNIPNHSKYAAASNACRYKTPTELLSAIQLGKRQIS